MKPWSGSPSRTTLLTAMGRVHRVSAWAGLAIVTAFAVVGGLLIRHRHRRSVLLLGPATIIVAVLTIYSGTRLMWDQLALCAVTVGTNMKGYTPLIHSDVRFVLLGSEEIPIETFRRWFWAHVLALPLALVALSVTLAWATRPRERAAGAD